MTRRNLESDTTLTPDGDWVFVVDDKPDAAGICRSVWVMTMTGTDGRRYCNICIGESEWKLCEATLTPYETTQLIATLSTLLTEITPNLNNLNKIGTGK